MPATVLKSLAVDAESTFGVFPTDRSGYAVIPAEEIAFAPTQEHLARPVQSASFGHKQTGITGPKGGTLTFKVGLHGLSTAADSGAAATEHAWVRDLLEACGLTRSAGTGDEISGTASTTTTVNVTNGANFAVGQFVVVAGEVRLVTAINANALTVTPALSAAPTTAGVDVHASAAYWLTGSDPSKSVSFIVAGDDHDYIASGCNGVVSLDTVAAGARPMLTLTFNVDTWSRDTSSLTGTLPALAMPNGIVAKASPFWWGSAKRAVREVGFATGQAIVAKASTAGNDGRSGWAYSDAEPVLTASAYRSGDTSDALQTDFETPTTRGFVLQLGSSPGRLFAVAAEVAQITSYPAEADAEGLVSLPLTASVKSPSTSGLPVFSLGFC